MKSSNNSTYIDKIVSTNFGLGKVIKSVKTQTQRQDVLMQIEILSNGNRLWLEKNQMKKL